MRLPCLASVLVVIGVNFSYLINAQLVGCDTVGCPGNPQSYLNSACALDGVVYNNLGIANFTSALSPSPFTWTIGTSETFDHPNSTQAIWSRGFYLGAPPALNMSNLVTITGCALFFEGISSNLTFPGSNQETSIGTCSDALTGPCVTDLLDQARSTLLQLSKSTGGICEALTDALANSAPKSCSAAEHGSWGAITAKNITGSSASVPIPIGACNPTTGANYSVSFVESYNMTAQPIATIVDPFIGGITPIMSVFLPATSNSENSVTQNQSTPTLNGSELHFSCLKIVPLQVKSPTAQSSSSKFVAKALYMVAGMLLASFLA